MTRSGNLRSGFLTMAIKSNISNNFHTGCYHTPKSRLVSSIPSPWKAGRCWIIQRFRRHCSLQECDPAPGGLSTSPAGPGGYSHVLVASKISPSHPVVRFMPPSGMWLDSTKERGPGRIPFTVHSSIVRLQSLPVYSSMLTLLVRGYLAYGGEWDKDTVLQTRSR